MSNTITTATLLGTAVAVITHDQAIDRILVLAAARRPAFVCFATAHMLVEAGQDQALRAVYNRADIITPDGRPVAWGLRLMGHHDTPCVSGPNLVPRLLRTAASCGVAVGFYGGRPETLHLMTEALRKQFPALRITYAFSPPFRPMTEAETEQVCADIRDSGARLLFVGLGSPKQEFWMGEHSASLPCVLLGVGAVFEFLSGEKKLPPEWVQNLGLTWLARLCQEPRRLLRRNLAYSPRFVFQFVCRHLLGIRDRHRVQDI
ncbi:MAG TPA: WecB/TagA/CpsF family glycosyltransferase [Bryobacteraceae bacterium]|nr:WecB/TagA/CpsF family glycosyltransferase [Bryobacteraceae bacterium]